MDYAIDNSKPWYHVDSELIPVKIIFCCYFGGMYLMFPYLPVLMKVLGLTTAQITIIYSILPLMNFLGPPLSGLLADRLRKYKLVTVMVLIMNCCFFSSLLSIPEYRVYNEPRIYSLSCNKSQALLHIQHCSTPSPCSSFMNKSFCRVNGQNSTQDICQSSVCHSSDWQPLSPTVDSSCIFLLNLTDAISYTSHSFCNSSCLALPDCVETEGDEYLTFLLYLVLRFSCQFFLTACYNLIDVTLMTVVKQRKAAYIRQRLWIHLAQAAMPPLVGLFIDRVSLSTGKTSFWPVFVCHNAMLLIAVILISCIKVDIESIKRRFFMQIKNAFVNKHSLYLYCISTFLGFFVGFYSTFLSIYLHEMKSPMSIIGLTSTAAALAGIPIMFVGDGLIRKLGHINIMIGSFFIHAIRFTAISYITAPWMAVPIETLKAFSQYLCWASILTFSSEVAPRGVVTTLTGLVRALYYGIGRGSGALVGGTIMTQLSTRITFRILGGAAIIVGILFGLIYGLWLRKYPIKKDNDSEDKNGAVKEYNLPMLSGPS